MRKNPILKEKQVACAFPGDHRTRGRGGGGGGANKTDPTQPVHPQRRKKKGKQRIPCNKAGPASLTYEPEGGEEITSRSNHYNLTYVAGIKKDGGAGQSYSVYKTVVLKVSFSPSPFPLRLKRKGDQRRQPAFRAAASCWQTGRGKRKKERPAST